jgi:putative heme-binding domain-containing protein
MRHRFALLMLVMSPLVGLAQRNARVPDPDPELERKTFIVPEGFEVSLWAADPLLAKPIQMNWDSQGRLWIASSEVYPQIKPGQKANDKILILEDTNNDGKADKTTIFADGLLIPTAVEPDQLGGCFAADSTDLVHFSQPDPKTGKATKKRIVLSGFGTEDTHHILHTFRTGPDSRLYMSQSIYIHSHIETPHGVRRLNAGGIWQFQPDSEKLEVFARGWVNSWGTAWTKSGVTFATDGAGGEGINYVVPGAAYVAARDVARILKGLNPGSPKYCGLDVVSGRHLPDDWQQNLITNDFRGHRVCRYILQEDGAGYIAKEQKEVIRSNHPAFRPIDVKMGPDGAIYIADWYNPIIQHGEVDFRDERRDKTHGRIWRITAKGRPLVEKPKISGAKIEDLLELLKAPEDWTRSHARRELAQRPMNEVLVKLRDWLINQQDESLALEALWVRQSHNAVDIDLVSRCLRAKSADVRASACRVAGDWASRHTQIPGILALAAKDEHPRVRLEAVRALAVAPKTEEGPIPADAIATALDQPVDRWLDYAIWLSLRETKTDWLPRVQAGKSDFGGDPKKLVFALQAAGEGDVTRPLLKLLESPKLTDSQRQICLLTLAGFAGSRDIVNLIEQSRNQPAPERAAIFQALESSVRDRKVGFPAGEWERFKQLINNETGIPRQAICRMVGYWKLEDGRRILEHLARTGELATPASGEDRTAAMDAIALLGGEKSVSFLAEAAQQNFDLNQAALLALMTLDTKRAADIAVSRFFTGSAESTQPIFAALLARKGGSAILTEALKDKTLNADVAKVGVRATRSTPQPDQALITALTKAGKLDQAKTTWTKPELDALFNAVKEQGDAARGEAVYRRAEMNCLKCHAIAGAGGQVGPDMTSIGASAQPDYLIESLLLPNAKIKEGYNSLIVTTLDGKIHTGVKLRESKEQLILRDAEDREITLAKQNIDEIKNGLSLMPQGLTDSLTRQEFVDLARFLSELGKGNYLAQPGTTVRRWQAITPTPLMYTAITRNRLAALATEPNLNWSSVYSKVQGDLPLAELPRFRIGQGPFQSAVRFQLDCTAAGDVLLKLNDATGLQIWIDEAPLEAKAELTVPIKPGLKTITLVINQELRKTDLQINVEEIKNSTARVRIVTGK